MRRFKSWAPNESYFISHELQRFLSKNADTYDILHAHSYHAFPALYVARTADRFFFTPHYHGRGHTFFRNLLHAPYRLITRKLICNATRIFCVSDYERSRLKADFKLADSKLIVLGNGIDPNEFVKLQPTRKDRTKILSVARLEEYKGLQYLIEALANEALQAFTLEIVGQGPFRARLIELAKNLDVKDRITFSSRVERSALLRKYGEAGVFCLLSRYEASGIVILESLASGTPCIVATGSALTEWVDGLNCLGIRVPTELSKLPQLIQTVSGRQVERTKLPSWNDVTQTLIKAYSNEFGANLEK